MKIPTATEALGKSWGSAILEAIENYVTWIMEHHSVTQDEARQLVLAKLIAKDGKVRKSSLIDFYEGKFETTTWIPRPGMIDLQIQGTPWIKSNKTSVKVGCVQFTNEAIFEVMRIMFKQVKSDKGITHQVGNYGDSGI